MHRPRSGHRAAKQEILRGYVQKIGAVAATLEPNAACAERQEAFETSRQRFACSPEAIHQQMATVMASFGPGLFVGAETFEQVHDNLDLERWFRLPKSHERCIHGHRHAGMAHRSGGADAGAWLDAHAAHLEPFTVEDLLPYRFAEAPSCQTKALHRRKIMRKARSTKNAPPCWRTWSGAIANHQEISPLADR